MKTVQLFHNPGAGHGEHSKKEVIALIKDNGYECIYTSTKEKAWKDELNEEADILAVAGGDGTVRKLVKELVKRTLLDRKHPLAVLPMGTANNISRSLNLTEDTEDIVAAWKQCHIQRYDMGRVIFIDSAPIKPDDQIADKIYRLSKKINTAWHEAVTNIQPAAPEVEFVQIDGTPFTTFGSPQP